MRAGSEDTRGSTEGASDSDSSRARLQTGLAWLRSHVELSTLLLFTLPTGSMWGFGELADEVLEGETRAFDRALLMAMRAPGNLEDPWGPPWFEEMARDYSGLGGVPVLLLLSLGATLFLVLQGHRRTAVFLVAVLLPGLLAISLLKDIFDRPRPDLVPHLSQVYSSSFPSGHSMGSTFIYLTLAGLLARHELHWRTRIFLIGAAVVVAVLVGMSRVYLGVHYPTDVVGGWAAGTAWALVCLLVARGLSFVGLVEPEASLIPPSPDGKPRD